jgi:signal transduction histidine kinase
MAGEGPGGPAAELNASRLRLMAELDGAYERIERELHDGVQQRLTTTGMELRLVEASLPDGDPARAALADIGEQLRAMEAEVRTLSRRTFPAILSEAGLGPAMRSFARHAPLPVELSIGTLPRCPALVETTAYHVVSDVVAHAARTQAGFVTVEISERDGSLRVVVTGGAEVTQIVRDRVDALGGRLETQAERVVAELPTG